MTILGNSFENPVVSIPNVIFKWTALDDKYVKRHKYLLIQAFPRPCIVKNGPAKKCPTLLNALMFNLSLICGRRAMNCETGAALFFLDIMQWFVHFLMTSCVQWFVHFLMTSHPDITQNLLNSIDNKWSVPAEWLFLHDMTWQSIWWQEFFSSFIGNLKNSKILVKVQHISLHLFNPSLSNSRERLANSLLVETLLPLLRALYYCLKYYFCGDLIE